MSASKLYQPFQLGDITLQNRVVMPPLTRHRADDKHVSGDLAGEYYTQRASVPGTLLVTEATFIAQRAGRYAHVQGICTDAQIAGWKKMCIFLDAEEQSLIFVRAGDRCGAREGLVHLPADVGPRTRRQSRRPAARVRQSGVRVRRRGRHFDDGCAEAATDHEGRVQLYTTAASNTTHKAGFDGVEIHNANGYFVDQFLQDVSNNRTDEYSGSIESWSRFSLAVIEAVTKAVGQKRVGIRFSPWGTFQDMRMKDSKPTFSHLVTKLRVIYPEFAYIHVTEPRVTAGADREAGQGESNNFLHKIWGPRPYLSAGCYTRDLAIKAADEKNGLIVFGRYFISNPDLPLRLKEDIPFTPYDRDTFYTTENPVSYTDYPFALRN